MPKTLWTNWLDISKYLWSNYLLMRNDWFNFYY